MAILRRLAAARPDAFGEDLAVSLWVLADRLDEASRAAEAIDANRAAIETLLPLFRHLPQAFAPRMAGMAKEYLERCQKSGTATDMALLAPVIAIFETLNQGGAPPKED